MPTMLMYLIAAVVTVLTFGAIVKKLEVWLALLTGGLVMAVIAWNPRAWSDAFARNMVVAGLLQAIPPVMGFAAVMELTGCNAHLVKMLTDPLVKVRPLLIPGSMLVTFFVNMALPSAAGCTAAVGVVLIPAMMAAGIHPAMAAASVFAGTWGSTWSPGNAHNAMVAKIANVPVMEVIQAHMPYTLSIAVVIALVSFVIDLAATALGAKRVGATRLAIVGAVIGTLGGAFLGIPGLIFGPFVGAVAGELLSHGQVEQAARAGVATWMGLIFGTLAKRRWCSPCFGVFAVAYFV